MGELTDGPHAAPGNGGALSGVMSKLVWLLLTAVTTAALLGAGAMLLAHDRKLAQQEILNAQVGAMSSSIGNIQANVAIIREDLARQSGRSEGAREARTGSSTTVQ